MLDIIARKLRRKGINPEKSKMPKHLAITVGGIGRYAQWQNTSINASHKVAFNKINEIIKYQIVFDIPIVTLYLINSNIHHDPEFSDIMDSLSEFFRDLSSNPDMFKNKVKVSIFGKWYDLPGRVVENIKTVIDETKDYDSFFLNLCINYDGQEEIVDAFRILLRKALHEKIDPDSIDKNMVKDNLYSSYFLPPDMMVKTGTGKRFHGFLLWDSRHALNYFSDAIFHEFKEKDLIKSIKYYQENKARA